MRERSKSSFFNELILLPVGNHDLSFIIWSGFSIVVFSSITIITSPSLNEEGWYDASTGLGESIYKQQLFISIFSDLLYFIIK